MIRLALPTDGERLAEIYAPAVVGSAISFELEPPDGAEMARRIGDVVARTPWLVCERDGIVVGYAYAGRFRERAAYQWSVEVSAYVAREAQSRGVGRALYTSLFAMLAVQGFRNAYAGVALPNDASIALHREVGFTPVGVYREVGYKLDTWHDVAWFERALAPRVVHPQPPRLLPELLGDGALLDAMQAGAPLLRIGERSAADTRSA
ncbi:MAG: arsinothricin resistance N-acetyltransferase ArsN1 family B [Gemmatimonadaceae bacterium]